MSVDAYGRPTILSKEDLTYQGVLVGRIHNADAAHTRAQAQAFMTLTARSSAEEALQVWLEHLVLRYGLKPDDGVDSNGMIHYRDPAWVALRNQEHPEIPSATFGESPEPESHPEPLTGPWGDRIGDEGPAAVPATNKTPRVRSRNAEGMFR